MGKNCTSGVHVFPVSAANGTQTSATSTAEATATGNSWIAEHTPGLVVVLVGLFLVLASAIAFAWSGFTRCKRPRKEADEESAVAVPSRPVGHSLRSSSANVSMDGETTGPYKTGAEKRVDLEKSAGLFLSRRATIATSMPARTYWTNLPSPPVTELFKGPPVISPLSEALSGSEKLMEEKKRARRQSRFDTLGFTDVPLQQ